MKQRGTRIAVIFVAVISLNTGVSGCATSRNDDEAQIRMLESRFVEAFRALDVNRIMECYVPDDTLFAYDVTPPRQFVGSDAYKKNWESLLKPFPGPVTVEMSDVKATTDGELGFGHSIIHFVGTDRDGHTVDLTMRVTDSYRKINGKWLIVEEHSSVPVGLATGKADFASEP